MNDEQYEELASAITSQAGFILQRIDVNVQEVNGLIAEIRSAALTLKGRVLVPKKLLGAVLHLIRILESQRPGMAHKDRETGELIAQLNRAFDALIYGPRP